MQCKEKKRMCKEHMTAMQDREGAEGDAQWELSRFAPLMQEVLEDLAGNKLNFDEYPYVQPPTSDTGTGPTHQPMSFLASTSACMHSLACRLGRTTL